MGEPSVIYGPSITTEDNHHWNLTERPGDDKFVRTNRAYIARHPEAVIRWLEPNCAACDMGHPLEWCEDEGVWPDCPVWGCNVRPTPYRRVDQ